MPRKPMTDPSECYCDKMHVTVEEADGEPERPTSVAFQFSNGDGANLSGADLDKTRLVCGSSPTVREALAALVAVGMKLPTVWESAQSGRKRQVGRPQGSR